MLNQIIMIVSMMVTCSSSWAFTTTSALVIEPRRNGWSCDRHCCPSACTTNILRQPSTHFHHLPFKATSLDRKLISASMTAAATTAATNNSPEALPRELLPITLGVFAQMLGEGISLSSLPLYMTGLGAPPIYVGMAISCFSVAQMTFAPVLVGLSSRIGRSKVLRICLAGAAAASLLIAFSGSIYGVIAGRTLAGIFAACVPVAQSAVTDIVSGREQVAIGLSRVSAASQLGVVVGPLVSAVFQEGFENIIGLPASKCLPAVFVLAACNAVFVLAQMTLIDRRSRTLNTQQAVQESFEETQSIKFQQIEVTKDGVKDKKQEVTTTVGFAQPVLRMITIVVGWTAILSNSIYGLFAPRFMGFQQAQLSATYSFAAILMVGTQIIFPKLISIIGEHWACTAGILATGVGIGGISLIRVQPLHSVLYMLNRSGAAIADTSTAALVASYSTPSPPPSAAGEDNNNKNGANDRSRNLALLTSTRASARIFSPLLSSKLLELSSHRQSPAGSGSTKGVRRFLDTIVPAGALPFVAAASFCMAVAPLPRVLRRASKKAEIEEKEKITG